MSDKERDTEPKTAKQAAAAYGSVQRSALERAPADAKAGERAQIIAEAMATYRIKRTVLDELDAQSRRRLEDLAAKVFSTKRED